MDFLKRHLHAFLYGGFWISLAGYSLAAPPERVALLESAVVTEGWHLALMALCFGAPVLLLYAWRSRGDDGPG